MYFLYYPHDACLSYNVLVLPIQQPSVSLLTNNRHGFINNWCIYSCSMLMYFVNVRTQTDSTDTNWQRLCSILATGVIRLQKKQPQKNIFIIYLFEKQWHQHYVSKQFTGSNREDRKWECFSNKYRSLKNNVFMSPYWEGKKKSGFLPLWYWHMSRWAAAECDQCGTQPYTYMGAKKEFNNMHFWWIFSSHCNRVERWTVKTKIHVKKICCFWITP